MRGLKTLQPSVLFLELTSDHGQKAIDHYLNETISDDKFNNEIIEDHMSSGFDVYHVLLDFIKWKGIRPICVDLPSKEYWEYNSDIEMREQFMIKRMKENLHEEKATLIIGGGHRLTILPLIRNELK